MKMKRTIFSDEHDLFRSEFRRFSEAELVPHAEAWNQAGISDRSAWKQMGENGFLGANQPEEYGGSGGDFLFDAIIMEELGDLRLHALQASLHTNICMPYLTAFATEEQKQRWLVPAIAGECLLAIAMTEPSTGSDLANVATKAIRDGDHYVLNGSKTFSSCGQNADLVIVVCKTDPDCNPPHDGMSLLLVEAGTPGFEKGRNLKKLGLKGQDTSEMSFSDCRVPVANLLGSEGRGFKMLMEKLQQERLCIGVGSRASCRRSLEDTLDYVRERTAFGKPIGTFQNTQFKLAEIATEIEIGQAFVDQLLVAHVAGEDIVSEVSMAKWWTSELQKKVSSECLQLFGGYGFMDEYPISRDYADAAVQTIYAGTNEIMKVIIAKRMGLG
jgi:acyl-CoA dehydrogenase